MQNRYRSHQADARPPAGSRLIGAKVRLVRQKSGGPGDLTVERVRRHCAHGNGSIVSLTAVNGSASLQ